MNMNGIWMKKSVLFAQRLPQNIVTIAKSFSVMTMTLWYMIQMTCHQLTKGKEY